MKTFNGMDIFKQKVEKAPVWEDSIKIGGKTYNMYEYGGGDLMNMDYDYIYFYNKRSRTFIYIKYICPAYQWRSGKKVKVKDYKFIDFEIITNLEEWR